MAAVITQPEPRLKNPGRIVPEATQHLQALYGTIMKGELSPKIIALVHLRASQVNGCSFCVDMGAGEAKKAGETDERLFAVAAWREAPYFTEKERAALALAEAVTRLSNRPDPVPDEIWDEAARHFNEKELALLILAVGVTNLFNRINVTIKQPAGVMPWAEQG